MTNSVYFSSATICFLVFSNSVISILHDFAICHDNQSLKPPDGVLKDHTFCWLGFVQYIHVTTGLPHHSKAPRVVLIHKQFTIGTATDLLHLPKNYKLGNVVFGDYERDEEDCSLTKNQVKMGMKCPRAYIEMPLMNIIPHPEFSRFGVGNSIALVRLLRPMKSPVPRDFDSEKMGKKTLKMYTHKDCRRHRMKTRLGSEGVSHVLCSSGCGVRHGAPLVSHALDGTFQLVGIAAGGGTCSRRAMRRRLNTEPPLYIDVYPYVTWIINVITAHELPNPYPHNFRRISVHRGNYLRKSKIQASGWRARVYFAGNVCTKSLKKQRATANFYTEKFEVNADPPAKLNIVMKISAGIECTIVCAKLLLPNRLVTPVIEGVGGFNISITFDTEWFPYAFYFSLNLFGKNSSQSDQIKWFYQFKDPRFAGFTGLN